MRTAIDWFKLKYQELYFEADITNMHFKTFEDKFYKLLDEAKQMEKEQIRVAYISGYLNLHSEQSANDYYEKNYKPETNEPN